MTASDLTIHTHGTLFLSRRRSCRILIHRTVSSRSDKRDEEENQRTRKKRGEGSFSSGLSVRPVLIPPIIREGIRTHTHARIRAPIGSYLQRIARRAFFRQSTTTRGKARARLLIPSRYARRDLFTFVDRDTRARTVCMYVCGACVLFLSATNKSLKAAVSLFNLSTRVNVTMETTLLVGPVSEI